MTPTDQTPTLAAQIEALEPCPHCGPGQSIVEAVQQEIGMRWQIFCGRCGSSSGSTKTAAEAAALWNRRTPAIVTALRQAEGYPQHIGDLHLGEDRSDGERLCSHDHPVMQGHPLYWPQQISQYDDSDPFCLEHAIERQIDRNSDYSETDRQAEAAPGVVEALDDVRIRQGHFREAVADLRQHLTRNPSRTVDYAVKLIDAILSDEATRSNEALARQHGAREDAQSAADWIAGIDLQLLASVIHDARFDQGRQALQWMPFGSECGSGKVYCLRIANAVQMHLIATAPATDVGEK